MRAVSLLVLFLSALPARATPKLVAVLPLDLSDSTMKRADRTALEESIRTIAGDLLTPAGYRVLTGDTTLAVLQDNGVDPTRACESSCALQTARELKAELFVSGTVATSEGEHIAFVRLFEARSGAQLGSVQIEGVTVKALRARFAERARKLFAPVLARRAEPEPGAEDEPEETPTPARNDRPDVDPSERWFDAAAPEEETPEEEPVRPAPARRDDFAVQPAVARAFPLDLGGAPATGASDALVTIVEYGDYQCPFTARAEPTLKDLLREYDGRVRRVFFQQPLPFHPDAALAAQAALAAGEQRRYWDMHDLLMQNQRALKRADLDRYAQALQLDMKRFRTALDSDRFKDRVEADTKSARETGATGTPTFFVNGRILVGAQPLQAFRQLVDEELKRAEAARARGVAPGRLYAELVATAPRPPAPESDKARKPAPDADARPFTRADVGDSPSRGAAGARVVLTVFSEFQCPFCARSVTTVKRVLETWPQDVRFVFKHNPLPFHANAVPAAKAAFAAGRQGRFWEMHDLLFANQTRLDSASLVEHARTLGLDLARFRRDMESPEAAARIEADQALAKEVGARGTPTFFVNGRKVTGAQPFEEFKRQIDEELAAR